MTATTKRPTDALSWDACKLWMVAEQQSALDALRLAWKRTPTAAPHWLYYQPSSEGREAFGRLGFYTDAPDSSWQLAEPGAYRGNETWERMADRLRDTARHLPLYPIY